jgi:hypothetical protein
MTMPISPFREKPEVILTAPSQNGDCATHRSGSVKLPSLFKESGRRTGPFLLLLRETSTSS